MQKLETELTPSGRTLKQVKRGRKCALYAVYNRAGVLYGYEVIKIKVLEPQVIFGQQHPRREAYPSGEEWGLLGWSFGNRQSGMAMEAFNFLLKQEKFAERERNAH